MNQKPLVTIFTPTFNRSKTLTRAYKSLQNQTSKNFIWQIFDDGSTDTTEQIVKSWIKGNEIEISYEKQKNMGKAKTANKSLYKTKTVLWFCLDSDDWLSSNAIEVIEQNYNLIQNREHLCGMIGLRYDHSEQPMQKQFIPRSLESITEQKLRYEIGILPEYVEIYKTEIINKYSFPEIKGESYVPFSYIQDQLDQKFEMLVLHVPIMYIEYQDDGITKNRKEILIKNPQGYMLFKKQLVEVAPTFKSKVIAAVTYNSACILAKKRVRFDSKKFKWLVRFTYPLGIIDYFLRFKLKLDLHFEKTF